MRGIRPVIMIDRTICFSVLTVVVVKISSAPPQSLKL